MVETIPLHEIMSVAEMNDIPETASRGSFKHTSSSEKSEKIMLQAESDSTSMNWSRASILQIKTMESGFNFGRLHPLLQSLKIHADILTSFLLAEPITSRPASTTRSGPLRRICWLLSGLRGIGSNASPASRRARRPSGGFKSRAPSRR